MQIWTKPGSVNKFAWFLHFDWA